MREKPPGPFVLTLLAGILSARIASATSGSTVGASTRLCPGKAATNWTVHISTMIDGSRSRKDIPIVQPEKGVERLLSDGREEVDEIWFALPLSAEARIREILGMLRHSTVTIRMVPDIFGNQLFTYTMTEVAGLLILNLSATPMNSFNRIVKHLEDYVVSIVILLLASPLMVLIALGVKLSSKGPVIYKQPRHGLDGTPFNIYKFRTMVPHEESGNQVTQAKKQDRRITPLGRFLRRTSLDELPQFINVLKGDMSVVGPRPHAVQHNRYYMERVDAYMQRHKVKPGITGWAQIQGWRGETDTLEKMERRVECDLFYIDNWSLLFDLKIIVITAFKGLMGRNAY